MRSPSARDAAAACFFLLCCCDPLTGWRVGCNAEGGRGQTVEAAAVGVRATQIQCARANNSVRWGPCQELQAADCDDGAKGRKGGKADRSEWKGVSSKRRRAKKEGGERVCGRRLAPRWPKPATQAQAQFNQAIVNSRWWRAAVTAGRNRPGLLPAPPLLLLPPQQAASPAQASGRRQRWRLLPGRVSSLPAACQPLEPRLQQAPPTPLLLQTPMAGSPRCCLLAPLLRWPTRSLPAGYMCRGGGCFPGCLGG
jgi:hypothetical protein